MLLGRKLLTGFLALILIISLWGLAITTSLDLTFSNSNNLKTWATQSDFYSGLLSKATTDTANALGSPGLTAQFDPIVKQNLEKVFPESQFNQDINTIIDSNYDWLEGKTTTPQFNIDLSQQKTAFAEAMGSYAETKYNSLPTCTMTEIASLTSTNPLTLTCKIPTISGSDAKATVTKEIESSSTIVKTPAINPSSFKTSSGKPYYSSLNIPKVYRHLKYVPVALAIIALICFVGIAFLSLRKRRAVKTLAFCFGLIGIVLLVVSASTTRAADKLSTEITKHLSLGSFTNPTNTLIHKIVTHVNSINLWFGIAYVVIAVALIALLLIKGRGQKSSGGLRKMNKTPEESKDDVINLERPEPPTPEAKIQPTAPELKSKNNKRLIQ